tara:strand:+ start:1630 stop:2379 length:750 start_codon:yes stop_codon:yes gene_type:complete
LNFKETNFKLKIILVEPSGPLNVGSIARLCSNFNVDQLRIVSPKCDIYSLETKKMALKGINLIKKCNIYESLLDSISDCDLVLATCGRIHYSKENDFDSLENISSWLRNFKELKNLAIIFGREDRGLTNRELLMANKVLSVKTNKNFPSLNLSHAVSIVLYELSKINEADKFQKKKEFDFATSKQIEDSFLEIEKLLLKTGYVLPHTLDAKISKFKKYIHRSETSKQELDVLRGIVHQINWAFDNQNKI